MPFLSRLLRRRRRQAATVDPAATGRGDDADEDEATDFDTPDDIHFLVAKNILSRHDESLDREKWDPLEHDIYGTTKHCGRCHALSGASSISFVVVLVQIIVTGFILRSQGGQNKICRTFTAL